MGLPNVGVPFMSVGIQLNWEYASNDVVYRLVTLAKLYSGLRLTLTSTILTLWRRNFF